MNYEDKHLAEKHRGGYSPLFALLVVREERDGTLTGYFGKEGTHIEQWDERGWPEPVSAVDLPDLLRECADRLEDTGHAKPFVSDEEYRATTGTPKRVLPREALGERKGDSR